MATRVTELLEITIGVRQKGRDVSSDDDTNCDYCNMVTRNDPPTCAGDEICQRKTPTYCEGDYSREFNYGCQTYCSCHEDSPTGSIDGMCDYCCAVVDGNCQ